jgi:gliding motility-associated-like protein
MRTAMGYTILPQLLTEGESLVLRWDAYNGWTGSTRYQVISSPLDKDNWELDGDTWETVYQLANNAGIRRYKVLAFEGSNSEYQRDDSLQSVQVYHRPHTDIWLPNAFTPTETSNNTFFPSAQYINPEGYSFTIFNRQGMMLFSTTQTDAFWDGRYNGVIQPNGVYVYKITFRQNDGTDQYLMGTVMLIR